MTIIFTSGRFWIEYHITPIVTVANGATLNQGVTPDRDGSLIGIAACVNVLNSADVGNTVTTGVLTVGQVITTVNIQTLNSSGAGNDMNHLVLLFMRSTGP